jgi:hypothetical protein
MARQTWPDRHDLTDMASQCAPTPLRAANDRGSEWLLLEDCGAATNGGNHPAIKMVKNKVARRDLGRTHCPAT